MRRQAAGRCDCGRGACGEPAWVERVDAVLTLVVAAGMAVLMVGVAAGWWGQ